MITIAVDTGNKQIKTENNVFAAGISPSENIGIVPVDEYFKKNGKYYVLSMERQPYLRDKSTSDRYFNLTLMAIVKELSKMDEAGSIPEEDRSLTEIYLLVGLPPAHMKDTNLKRRFINYFIMDEPVKIVYKGKSWNIRIKKVSVYSQCFAALTTIYNNIKYKQRVLAIDMGGFTADYMVMRNGKADINSTDSLESGIIILYQRIKKECMSRDYLIEEDDIDGVLRGKSDGLDAVVVKIIKRETEKFVENFLTSFREYQIDLKNYHVVFIGGASLMLKPYLEESSLLKHYEFIEDVMANAKGYKMLHSVSVASAR